MEAFDYEKQEYAITLKSGEIVICWPNANVWHALDGSGRIFTWDEITKAAQRGAIDTTIAKLGLPAEAGYDGHAASCPCAWCRVERQNAKLGLNTEAE